MFTPPRVLPVDRDIHATLAGTFERAASRSFIDSRATLVGSSYRGREGREEVMIAFQQSGRTCLRVVRWDEFRKRCRVQAIGGRGS